MASNNNNSILIVVATVVESIRLVIILVVVTILMSMGAKDQVLVGRVLLNKFSSQALKSNDNLGYSVTW